MPPLEASCPLPTTFIGSSMGLVLSGKSDLLPFFKTFHMKSSCWVPATTKRLLNFTRFFVQGLCKTKNHQKTKRRCMWKACARVARSSMNVPCDLCLPMLRTCGRVATYLVNVAHTMMKLQVPRNVISPTPPPPPHPILSIASWKCASTKERY